MNGLASKKRRKQSKPIRLGNDSIGEGTTGEGGEIPTGEQGEATEGEEEPGEEL